MKSFKISKWVAIASVILLSVEQVNAQWTAPGAPFVYTTVYGPGTRVGIGITTPLESLHINGSIRGNQTGALRVSTGTGYMDIGPKSTASADFFTDRASYSFDKKLIVKGNLGLGGLNTTVWGANLHILSYIDQNTASSAKLRLESFETYYVKRYPAWQIEAAIYDGVVSNDLCFKYGESTSQGTQTLATKIRLGNTGFVNATGFSSITNSAYFLNPSATGTSLNVAGSMFANGTVQASGFVGGSISNTGSTGNIAFSTNSVERMRIFSNTTGTVYIGANSPTLFSVINNTTFNYKLAVNGSIIATEVVVKLNTDWPDYVFAPEYNLKTLDEVDTFIKERRHLPNVPSYDIVAEEGVNLGEMNKILLQKIEEITLYLIEQEKKMKTMQEEISQLKK
ncbi:MAG: hypothetical protein M0P66_09695 [Salinivirgaceae bacterium]|nr:hypothetical protein [Salinivirgaceae bacterium]